MREDIPRKKKRRSCYDRVRKRSLEIRRGQTSNPAASAALQLLGVFGFLFGRIPTTPSIPVRYSAPAISPRQAQRNDVARHLGIPTRYLDIVLDRGKVPYGLLFEHIRLGGATRRDALNELRKRIPTETLDWFMHIEKRAIWSELSLCFRQGDEEEDTNLRFLHATLAWAEEQQTLIENSSGPAEADKGFRPNMSGDVEDDQHEPKP